MRVCPKCKFIDPACWRGSISHREIDFTKFDSFMLEYPDTAQRLLADVAEKGSRNFVEDTDYAYHLTKGGNVERQAKLDNPMFYVKWIIPVEGARGKPKKGYAQCIKIPVPKSQTLLVSSKQKEAQQP